MSLVAMYSLNKVGFICWIVLINLDNVIKIEAVFKMTKVECAVADKNFVQVTLCRLKAVRRDVAEFTMKLQLLQKTNDCTVNIEIFRKYNGYKPFPLNFTWDACTFIENPKHPVTSLVYNLFKDFTNINHSCPYEGEVVINQFYLEHKKLGIALPSGEYLLRSNWLVKKKLRISVNVWFVFEEIWQ